MREHFPIFKSRHYLTDDDAVPNDEKVDHKYRSSWETIHYRTQIKKSLISNTRHRSEWYGTARLFRMGIMLSMYIFSNPRLNNEESFFEKEIGSLNKLLQNGRVSKWNSSISSFIQDNMYYKSLICLDYLLGMNKFNDKKHNDNYGTFGNYTKKFNKYEISKNNIFAHPKCSQYSKLIFNTVLPLEENQRKYDCGESRKVASTVVREVLPGLIIMNSEPERNILKYLCLGACLHHIERRFKQQ